MFNVAGTVLKIAALQRKINPMLLNYEPVHDKKLLEYFDELWRVSFEQSTRKNRNFSELKVFNLAMEEYRRAAKAGRKFLADKKHKDIKRLCETYLRHTKKASEFLVIFTEKTGKAMNK